MSHQDGVPRGPPPDYGSVETQQPTGYPPQPPYAPTGQAPPPPMNPTEPPPKYEAGPGMYNSAYQQGYQPTTQHTTIIVQERYGPCTRMMECPYCHASITTRTELVAGGLVWLTAALICLFGCWAGCCLIPFCITDLHDVRHTCPNCERLLGTYHKL